MSVKSGSGMVNTAGPGVQPAAGGEVGGDSSQVATSISMPNLALASAKYPGGNSALICEDKYVAQEL